MNERNNIGLSFHYQLSIRKEKGKEWREERRKGGRKGRRGGKEERLVFCKFKNNFCISMGIMPLIWGNIYQALVPPGGQFNYCLKESKAFS